MRIEEQAKLDNELAEANRLAHSAARACLKAEKAFDAWLDAGPHTPHWEWKRLRDEHIQTNIDARGALALYGAHLER